MSEFTCPKCHAKNHPSPGVQGCMACGFGRPKQTEERPPPPGPKQTEVQPPPGYEGKYLTEQG